MLDDWQVKQQIYAGLASKTNIYLKIGKQNYKYLYAWGSVNTA